MQASEQTKKKIKIVRKSQLLLFGSFLIFIGVVCISWNHLKILREEVFENVRIQMIDHDFEGTSDEKEETVVTPNVENIDDSSSNQVTGTVKPSYSYNYIGYLEIPKIGLKRGFVDKNSKYNDINYNVAIGKTADYPDVEKGNFILMAHSGDAYISYFANLYRLGIGDIAKVTYRGEQYQYKIVKIEEQPKTGVIAIHRDNYNTKALTLITCTKDNDTAQTIYILELI